MTLAGLKACPNPLCEQPNPQPLTNFFRKKDSSDGRASNCKSCNNRAVGRWNERNAKRVRANKARYQREDKDAVLANRRKNAEKLRQNTAKFRAENPEYQRTDRLWRTYKMTPEDYQRLLDKQGGVCAICGKPPNGKLLSVDHDHACCPTDKSCGQCVGGLLCNSCNWAIGRFDDNPNMAISAAIYLFDWRKKAL